jgi:hypothetical protein
VNKVEHVGKWQTDHKIKSFWLILVQVLQKLATNTILVSYKQFRFCDQYSIFDHDQILSIFLSEATNLCHFLNNCTFGRLIDV